MDCTMYPLHIAQNYMQFDLLLTILHYMTLIALLFKVPFGEFISSPENLPSLFIIHLRIQSKRRTRMGAKYSFKVQQIFEYTRLNDEMVDFYEIQNRCNGMHFPEIDFYLKIQYTYGISSKISTTKK